MKLIIDEQSESTRIDIYLTYFLPNLSRSKIQSIIKDGRCLVNNNSVKTSYLLKFNDVVEFDDLVKEDTINLLPEDIQLDIVWEDENMVVVNKPSNMLTHPTTIETSGTLVNALLYKYGENLSDIGGDLRRGIVHRLDRNTSGLIMVAKNNNTHEYLVSEMKMKNFNKKYLAIVRGVMEYDTYQIDTPIGRHPTQPQKMSVGGKGAKDSLSKVCVLERFKDATLVEVALITGRTHQIRVHMASIGHPVYNDTLYGFGKVKIKTEEQVLQSYKLEFSKPFTQERVFLEIPMDSKLKKVYQYLKQC